MCYSALVKRELNYLELRYDAHVVREQIDDYSRRYDVDAKRFPKVQDRIFPGSYAPVIFEENGSKRIEYMRYGTYPPSDITNLSNYTSFNARRDNLQSHFWSNAFMKHHGYLVLQGFFEWVAVKDLLQAGIVTIKDIEAEFQKQTQSRKEQILAKGKVYKPTPTELKDPRMRQIIIKFEPEDGEDLIVPVVFSRTKLDGGMSDSGFAIVTDDPTNEIEAAGHDRCPVILTPGAEMEWCRFSGKTPQQMVKVLTRNKRVIFTHRLDIAA